MNNSAKLIDAFVQGIGISAEKITEDLVYGGVREWDSIAHMALASKLEDAFGITLDTQDIIEMNSVGKVREILGKHGIVFDDQQ